MIWKRVLVITVVLSALGGGTATAADEPTITASDLIAPSQLNGELAEVNAGKIVLIQVGFLTMYKMGHIPGSQYAGAASHPDGPAALRKLAAKFPRDQRIVVYCGCCPWDDCPNVRPAFRALKEMGFTHLKVLDIPQRLGDDWTAKGYPVVKGE
jgi:rhodanese-related sulfurtransferase